MSDAPERIWLDPDDLPSGHDKRFAADVEYVRADRIAALEAQLIEVAELRLDELTAHPVMDQMRRVQRERKAKIAALEAEAKDLQAKLTECCLQALATDGQAGEALDRAIKAEAEVARLREALTPSAATKDAYWGEFSFQRPTVDEDGDPTVEQVQVPWTTIKAIMAAIRARAALGDASAQQDIASLNTGDAT